MDGRPKRREKNAFLNLSSVVCTGQAWGRDFGPISGIKQFDRDHKFFMGIVEQSVLHKTE